MESYMIVDGMEREGRFKQLQLSSAERLGKITIFIFAYFA